MASPSLYVGAALSVLVLAEAAALWYLWSRYRTLQDKAAVADSVAEGLQAQLAAAYRDLAAAREALVKQNDLEAKHDEALVTANPGLDAALDRINGL